LRWTLQGNVIVVESNFFKMADIGQDAAIVTVERLERGGFGALRGSHSWRRVGAGKITAGIKSTDHCRIAWGTTRHWTRGLCRLARGFLNNRALSGAMCCAVGWLSNWFEIVACDVVVAWLKRSHFCFVQLRRSEQGCLCFGSSNLAVTVVVMH
jgi:hypothetical protein